jgi:hypothetical protein
MQDLNGKRVVIQIVCIFLPNRFVSTSEIVFMLRGSAGRNGVPRLNLTPDPGLTNRRRNDDY